jgi:hypothetical protein
MRAAIFAPRSFFFAAWHTFRALLKAAAVLSFVTGVSAGAVVAASYADPVVVPVDRAPLTIRGHGFQPREHVLVRAIVRGGPRRSKTLVAGPRGGFTARFLSLEISKCGAYSIRATGSRGSKAVFTAPPPPCGPAP